MFINCPYCRALVATDPATDLPPERCPRCAAKLREMPMDAAQPDATSLDVAESARADVVPGPSATQSIAVHNEVPPAPFVSILAPAPDTKAQVTRSSPVARAIAEPHEVPPAPSVSIVPTTPHAGTPMTTSTHAVVVSPAAVRPFASLLKPAAPDAATTTMTATPPVAIEPAASTIVGTDATHYTESRQPLPTATIDPAGNGLPKERLDDAVAVANVDAAVMAFAAESAQTPRPVAKSAPSFARRGTATAPAMDWKLPTVLATLILLLLLQLLLAERNRLAADARWRPAMSALCGALHCTLPAWHEPAALALLDRDVRPHPDRPGVLRVTATFRNDARWPQPWPRLQLTLSDIDGNPVAAREFGARDYLGAAPTQVELRSGQSASIAMDIVEPAGRSVAFDFALR